MQCEEEETFIASCVAVQERRGALTGLPIAERWYCTRTIRTGDAALTPDSSSVGKSDKKTLPSRNYAYSYYYHETV